MPGRVWAAAAGVTALVVLVYGQGWHHDFIRRYDDGTYFVDNPVVRNGFSVAGVRWAFGFHAANWHPLTWLSHMLDGALFGGRAGGAHLHSALLHASAAAAALAVLHRATGAFWSSAFVAALFALHPLRVESVAWVAERKDVLSGLLWFLCIGAYLRHVRRPTPARAAVVAAWYALAVAAKPMAVSLPLVLLVIDWWPLARLRRGGTSAGSPAALVLEKAPLLAMSAAAAALAQWSHSAGIYALVRSDAPGRFANAVASYAWYLQKSLWPADLAVLYPFPEGGLPAAEVAAAAALVAALVAAAFAARRTRPYLLAGVLWYLTALLPVIGLVQVGAQARADRYTYLPSVGLAIAAVWLAGGARLGAPARRRARALLAAAVLASFAAASFLQARFWRDGVTLFSRASRVTENNYLMFGNLGAALIDASRYADAVPALEQALRVNPEHCDSQFNLGSALFYQERYEAALAPYRRALDCYVRNLPVPRYLADAHFAVGAVSARLGRTADAEAHLGEALRLQPRLAEAARLLAELEGRAPGRR